jgi:hypothetical protein
VSFRQGNEPVQTLSTNRPDDALADRIHLRTVRRGFQNSDPERPDRLVKFAGEDTVAIMNQKSVSVTEANHLTQLLQCPGSAWMSRHVVVDQSPAAMLDDHKHIHQTKGCCHRDEEIASNDSLRMQV